jgi:predicted secreted hydrolase
VKKTFLTISLLLAFLFSSTACKDPHSIAPANDFAILAQQEAGYKQAGPGKPLVFPRDHGAHPGYRIEWWYLTANLEDGQANPYGIQWTLFRVATESPGPKESVDDLQAKQLFMAHFAITTPSDHVSFQRYARGDENPQLARAGVNAAPFSAWMDDWVIESSGDSWLPLQVQAQQDGFAFKLQLKGDMPPVLQGDAGYSQKHADGGGSFYYSQPFLRATGQLEVDGQVVPVTGEAWLDREWGSQFLKPGQLGWDWFSLHLESGEKLMLFQLRERTENGGKDHYTYGQLMSPDGNHIRLDPGTIQLRVTKETRVDRRILPMQWSVELPQIDRQMTVTALHPNQWMEVDFPYWEGVVIVTGEGDKNRGKGYMELTGYPVQPD